MSLRGATSLLVVAVGLEPTRRLRTRFTVGLRCITELRYPRCTYCVKLKHLCEIKTDLPEADFWLVRSGSKDSVGQPVKVYSKEHNGIKVTEPEVILPEFLYYMMQYFHMRGYFASIALGTLKLVHIRVEDVKNMPVGTN